MSSSVSRPMEMLMTTLLWDVVVKLRMHRCCLLASGKNKRDHSWHIALWRGRCIEMFLSIRNTCYVYDGVPVAHHIHQLQTRIQPFTNFGLPKKAIKKI
jgi:hypothetical protein